jgi:hypothetical protein
MIDEPDQAEYIKINRRKWAGYVMRMIINGQRRECLTSDQKEKEELEDLS